jgi:hypothetical protein
MRLLRVEKESSPCLLFPDRPTVAPVASISVRDGLKSNVNCSLISRLTPTTILNLGTIHTFAFRLWGILVERLPGRNVLAPDRDSRDGNRGELRLPALAAFKRDAILFEPDPSLRAKQTRECQASCATCSSVGRGSWTRVGGSWIAVAAQLIVCYVFQRRTQVVLRGAVRSQKTGGAGARADQP